MFFSHYSYCCFLPQQEPADGGGHLGLLAVGLRGGLARPLEAAADLLARDAAEEAGRKFKSVLTSNFRLRSRLKFDERLNQTNCKD